MCRCVCVGVCRCRVSVYQIVKMLHAVVVGYESL